MNFTILRYDSLASTNDEAAKQARLGANEGLCILARQQTAGRGRRERVWISPADAGIYFSLVLRPKFEIGKFPLITLAAAVAVYNSILESCNLKTDIKWANDVHAGGKKLCGILAETVEGNAVVLGIGINLKKEAVAPELAEIATSIESETSNSPDSEKLIQALTKNLKSYYEILHKTGGAAKIIKEWQARSSYARGKKVRVNLETEVFEGVTDGLEIDGALRVRAENGLIRTIHAGDIVSLRQNERL